MRICTTDSALPRVRATADLLSRYAVLLDLQPYMTCRQRKFYPRRAAPMYAMQIYLSSS